MRGKKCYIYRVRQDNNPKKKESDMFTLSSMTTKYFIDSKIARPAGKGIKIGIKKGEPIYKTWDSIYSFVEGSNETHHEQNAQEYLFICDGLNLTEKKNGNHSAYARSGKGFAFDWVTREGFYLEQKVGKNLYNGNDKVDFCTGNPRYVQSVLNTLCARVSTYRLKSLVSCYIHI